MSFCKVLCRPPAYEHAFFRVQQGNGRRKLFSRQALSCQCAAAPHIQTRRLPTPPPTRTPREDSARPPRPPLRRFRKHNPQGRSHAARYRTQKRPAPASYSSGHTEALLFVHPKARRVPRPAHFPGSTPRIRSGCRIRAPVPCPVWDASARPPRPPSRVPTALCPKRG